MERNVNDFFEAYNGYMTKLIALFEKEIEKEDGSEVYLRGVRSGLKQAKQDLETYRKMYNI